MTHMKPMADSEGTFNADQEVNLACRECGHNKVEERRWESNCGGYIDYQYRCLECGYVWWAEGPDA